MPLRSAAGRDVSQAALAPAPTPTPSLAAFALLLTRIGLTSFGGGLSGWMMREVVQRRRWLTEEEFLNGQALCQVLPGINIVNLCIWMGHRLHGGRGALAGALAMIVPPGVVAVAITLGFARLAPYPAAHQVLDGVAAAAVGFSLSMGLRAARRSWRDAASAVILLACFAAIGLLRLPLVPVIAVLTPISIGIAWRRLAPAAPSAGRADA